MKTLRELLALAAKRPLPVVNNRLKPLIYRKSPTVVIRTDELISKEIKTQSTIINLPMIYWMGDAAIEERILMKSLGLDIGTKNVVVAYRKADNQVGFITEVNGYWIFERATPFVENMLNDGTKVRSDGTCRPARWIKLPDSGKLCVLGRDAEELAFSMNSTLQRPMAEGGIAADDEAMTVLASIVQGLLETAEKDIGKFGDAVNIFYCTTAPAINRESNLDYHERVVNLIIDGYESAAKLKTQAIKESHAIVLNESTTGTGIGISWGAGTVTVSYVKYGIEIYSFCWVGAGDWIDREVAMRHGYASNQMKRAKETPTTIAKRKHSIDLTPGKTPDDRIDMDIVLHYDVLINQVVDGIIAGFVQNEAAARIDEPITVYMAGGTSSPTGFVERVQSRFDEKQLPFEIAFITRSTQPLFTVAEGCLKAAEIGQ